jgi:hypothetical protein
MPQMLVNGEIVEIDHEEHAEVTSNLDVVAAPAVKAPAPNLVIPELSAESIAALEAYIAARVR